MGMRPAKGRYFAPEEEGSRAPNIVVLSYAFWQSRLGGDPNVLGKTIALDRLPHTIIGVMPQGFDFPRGTQVWMPLRLDEASQKFITLSRPIFTVVHSRPPQAGVSPQEVQADLNRMAERIRAEYQNSNQIPLGLKRQLDSAAAAPDRPAAARAAGPERRRRAGPADRVRQSR